MKKYNRNKQVMNGAKTSKKPSVKIKSAIKAGFTSLHDAVVQGRI